MYKYKVTHFDAVTKHSSGFGERVRLKLEEQLEEHANDGWEFVGQYRFTYELQAGCLAGLFGKKDAEGSLQQLVFRKEV